MQRKTENETIGEHGDETEQKIMNARRIAPATSAGTEGYQTSSSSLGAVESSIIEETRCEKAANRWEKWVEKNRVWIFLTIVIILVIFM